MSQGGVRTVLPPLAAPAALLALQQRLAPLQAVAADRLRALVHRVHLRGGCGASGRAVLIQRDVEEDRGSRERGGGRRDGD